MFKTYSLRVLILTAIIFCVKSYALAQTDQIEGFWYNDEKSARVQIYKAVNGMYCGKIVWLKDPAIGGKPKVDFRNPDEKKRNVPLLGLVVLKGFKKDGANEYTGGTIYDPQNGKTYSSIMTCNGNKLDVRGYYGFSWIGRSATWTKAD